jgi:DNA-binding NarL/FixJ family response regulator
MNILIVEDHPMVREVLGSVAREAFGEPSIDTAGSCAEGVAKLRAAEVLDMVLLDLGLPDSSGLDTLRRFRRARAEAPLVAFSENDDPSCALAAMADGARGYLSKALTRPVISAALRLVAAGGIYVPLLAIEARREEPAPRRQDLTARQTDVMRLIVRGFPNKDIALKLKIAEDTVKQHARAAYAALGVRSRTQAMTAVARRGLRLD